jgi:nicotinamide-nucleotide adenylyltransferase
MERCDFMYVGITNPDPGLTRKDEADDHRALPAANPCTYYERLLMIRGALRDHGYGPDRFCVVPFPINVPDLWRYYAPPSAVYFLTIYDAWGERKRQLLDDAGLQTEVMWRRPEAEKGIIGSDIRARIASGHAWESLVPETTKHVIAQFNIVRRIRQLVQVDAGPSRPVPPIDEGR